MAYSEKRKTTHLEEPIAKLLISQIQHEWQNELLYKNFSIWSGVRSLFGHEIYFYKRSQEELNHGKLIYQFLLDSDYQFSIPVLNEQPVEIKGDSAKDQLKSLHDAVLDREILTTDMINNIAKEALGAGDYATFTMIQELVTEQVEEELRSHEALDQFEISEDIILIDKRVKKILE